MEDQDLAKKSTSAVNAEEADKNAKTATAMPTVLRFSVNAVFVWVDSPAKMLPIIHSIVEELVKEVGRHGISTTIPPTHKIEWFAQSTVHWRKRTTSSANCLATESHSQGPSRAVAEYVWEAAAPACPPIVITALTFAAFASVTTALASIVPE